MNIEPATKNPLATEEICGMLNMISTLIEKGYAYVAADGTVYYSVRKFKDYGKLSHKNLDDLQSRTSVRSKVTGERQAGSERSSFSGNRKRGEPYWSLRGARAVRAGTSSVPLWQRDTSATRSISMQAVRT